ncbi:hypothetical protein LBMAG37_02780 [Anaerolineae bacterium]|nr:hypothetical protein LBMAG37_02780 [Anaerolineae bacterium]
MPRVNPEIDVQLLLGLRQPPIAIGFLQSVPAGLPRWDGPALAAGCGFWPQAMAGRSFYTLASDHFNCAVGCHTHRLELSPERAGELGQAIGLMTDCGYIAPEEVAGIPVLASTPRAVAYGPADNPGFAADVVLIAAQPAQAMLLYEAALLAGAGNPLTNVLGRPACAVLPLTVQSGTASASFGCKGNRVNSDLPDSEMYLSIPAAKWGAVKLALTAKVEANANMGHYYLEKRAAIAAA